MRPAKAQLRKKSRRRIERARYQMVDLLATLEQALSNPTSANLSAMQDKAIRLQESLTTLLIKTNYTKRC